MQTEDNSVVSFPGPPPSRPIEQEDDGLQYVVAIVNTSIRILNARLIAILGLIGAIGIWVLAAIDPSTLRIWAAAGYSITVLFPALMLYSRKS